ncbi:hypothetical protein Rsub_11048 [Raphidocelis subcapitata]|uniref:Uncharacterized protein n=1 Tax=Raphidocelis subcapitata TaxID=307507 RepID=A0A2V0PEE4_9CHLO|nr:hypothetical protein Rsub_11048 [Raphidocelis subcapitata]|eukprot:GBF98228.1 hypothetical protein Rsub_11048 [Raphidocelis subcapitata]
MEPSRVGCFLGDPPTTLCDCNSARRQTIGRPLAARRTACRAAGGGSGSGSGRAGAPAPADTAAPAAEEERYAYSDPVNKALGNFLPTAGAAAKQLGNIDWGAPKAAGLPLQELARRFTEEFLKREWFVTGARVRELEAALSRERAARASEVARRDALLAQCRDAILALEAQLAEAHQRAAPPQQPASG